MDKILFVALGGAIGAVSRFLTTEWIQKRYFSTIPYGTVVVNLVGAFLIGILMSYFLEKINTPMWLKLLLVTGGLGGLTTFSTFSFEWLDLFLTGNYTGALLYGGIQLVGGLLLCALGLFIGRLVW